MKGPQKRGPEAYRQLADRFREAARKVSEERERVRLLSMAKKWDVVADYLQRHSRNSTNQVSASASGGRRSP